MGNYKNRLPGLLLWLCKNLHLCDLVLFMKNIFRSTIFLAIVACWLWSTAFAGVKVGLQYQAPLQFAGLRFVLAGIILLPVYGNLKRYFIELRQNFRFVMLIALIQVFGQYAFFYSGMNLVPGALGAMIIGSSPLFVAVVAHFSFHDDKMTRRKIASILLGVCGIAVITLGRQKIAMAGFAELLGILLLFINNFISGSANVVVAKRQAPISPVLLSSATLIIGGFLLCVVSIPLEGIKTGPFPLPYFISLGWLAFLSAAAYSIWYALLKRPGVKVSSLNTWKFLIPVSGAILSWLVVEGEHPDLPSVTGMVLIAGSLVLLNFNNRKSKEVNGVGQT